MASFVVRALTESGYEVVHASTVRTAERLWAERQPELVILDLMLPDGNGIDLLVAERSRGSQTPVLVLSAKSAMSDRVSGLDSGADDYLPKPFGIEELLARVRVLLRRERANGAGSLAIGGFCIDFDDRRVTLRGRTVFLSDTEYRLLELLAKNYRRPVSKAEILEHVWDDPQRDDNVVEVYVSYLRNKLERGKSPRLIHTVRGKGYVLE